MSFENKADINRVDICNNKEDFSTGKLVYNPNLIMISIKKKNESNDKPVIYCFTMKEIEEYILIDRFFPHHEYEVKHYSGTGFLEAKENGQYYTPSQMEEIKIWNLKNRETKSDWIYNIPYLNVFVDHTFNDCIEKGKNSIVLTPKEEKYIFKSYGRSAVKGFKAKIYSAEAVARCEMISPFLNEEERQSCDDTSTLKSENENLSLEEEEEESEEEKKKREEYILETQRKMEALKKERGNQRVDYIDDYRQEKKIEDGQIYITRYANDYSDDVYFNENIPTTEFYDEAKRLKVKKWFNHNKVLHRQTGPAIIYEINGFVTDERWIKNGLFHRKDEPAIISYFPNSNRIQSESWMINGAPPLGSIHRKEYFNNENHSLFLTVEYKDNHQDGIIKGYYDTGKIFFEKIKNKAVIFADTMDLKMDPPQLALLEYNFQTKTLMVENKILSNISRKMIIARKSMKTMFIRNEKVIKEFELDIDTKNLFLKIYENEAIKILKNYKKFYEIIEDKKMDTFKLSNYKDPVSADSDDIKNRNSSYAIQVWYPNGNQKEIVSYDEGLIFNSKVGSYKRWNENGDMVYNFFKTNKKGVYPYKDDKLCIIKFGDHITGQKALNEKGDMLQMKTFKKTDDEKEIINFEKNLKDFKPDLSLIYKRDFMDNQFIDREMTCLFVLRNLLNMNNWDEENKLYQFLALFENDFITNIPNDIISRIQENYPEYDETYFDFEKTDDNEILEVISN